MAPSHPATAMADAKSERRTSAQRGDDSRTGGREAAPSPHWLARLRRGAWFAVLIKGVSIGVAMLGLAAIGTVSIQRGPGVSIDRAQLHSASALPTAQGWLATASAAPPQAGSSGAPSSDIAQKEESPGAAKIEPSAPQSGITADGKVILNTATAAELTRLPSVGEKRAQQIVELRVRLKRFRSASDLLRVRGIGPRSLKKMMPYLVLDPPTAEPAKETPKG